MAPRTLIIPEYDRFGGTLTFLLKLLTFHGRHNLETAVLISKSQQISHVLDAFREVNASVYVGSDRLKPFRAPYLSLLYDVAFCWQAYQSFKPDLMVVSSGTLRLMLGALVYPVPVICVFHSYPIRPIWDKESLGMRLYMKAVCRFDKNCFVTVSRASAGYIHQYFNVPVRSLRVIYNGVRQVVGTNCVRQKIVLTIGRITSYKNPERWLDVAASVTASQPDVQFVWVGDGELRHQLVRQVAALGLESRVLLPSYDLEVDGYYSEASVYFQPSLLESQGIAVLDAMAHGLPCVVSNVGGLPEMVIDGKSGFLCDPDDVDGFSARLVELLTSAALREQMGQTGRQRAQVSFSEETQETEILALYQTMLGRK